MKVAPFRALTHFFNASIVDIMCRNEGRPFQGIDTIDMIAVCDIVVVRRNEGRPFQGIDTIP